MLGLHPSPLILSLSCHGSQQTGDLCFHVCPPHACVQRYLLHHYLLSSHIVYLIVQGLEKGFDYKKVLKAFKKGEPLCRFLLLMVATTCQCTSLYLISYVLYDAPLAVHSKVPADVTADLALPCRVLLQRNCCGGRRARKGHPAAG